MESQRPAKKRCPMCSSSNSLTAAYCEVCGHIFDVSQIQIVVPMGGTVSALERIPQGAPVKMRGQTHAAGRVPPRSVPSQPAAIAKRPKSAANTSLVATQTAKPKQSDRNAELARLLASSNAASAAKASDSLPLAQLGIWMLISLVVLIGAVLATAAIFMNSTVVAGP